MNTKWGRQDNAMRYFLSWRDGIYLETKLGTARISTLAKTIRDVTTLY